MPTWLNTVRLGPLTGDGSEGAPPPHPLQDTRGKWFSGLGVDEGVSLLASNGRTYIYFGDLQNDCNYDPIAWTGEPHVQTHGPHYPAGVQFFLPNSSQGGQAITQQSKWWFCSKCCTLFYADPAVATGHCPYDNGLHNPQGYEFYLPAIELGASAASGQTDWRFCGKCKGLCFGRRDLFGNPIPFPADSCPAGGPHAPIGWTFVLPNDAQGAGPWTGQDAWRYCGYCWGLFFSGYIHKGTCPNGPGGGLRISCVLASGTQQSGSAYMFQGDGEVGPLKSVERPGGVFEWNQRIYVFANIASPKYSRHVRRDAGNPQFGQYLLSTSTPEQASQLNTHYLFSPRIGTCRLADGTMQSHHSLGKYFYVVSSVAATSWRRCKVCESLFELVPGNNGRCWGDPSGGIGHIPYPGEFYVVTSGSGPNTQTNWRRCANCLMLVFDGYSSKLRCPLSLANHLPAGPSYGVSFSPGTTAGGHNNCSTLEDDIEGALSDAARGLEGGWRYCSECQCLVFTQHDNTIGAAVPYVVTVANHLGDLPYPPPPTGGVTFSGKAAAIISHRFGRGDYKNPNNPNPADSRYPGFNLACWHLPMNAHPRLCDLLYFNPQSRQWTPNVADLPVNQNLFDFTYPGQPDGSEYTETGLLWLPGPGLWLMTYTTSQPADPPTGRAVVSAPVYARLSPKLTDLHLAADIPIFDPGRPAEGALLTNPAASYPYGPYPLERYTTWNPQTGILDLCYLLSLFEPYEVQVMRTQIQLP